MATDFHAPVVTGTDIVSVGRVARLVETGGDRFVRRWFTAAEIDYCSSRSRPAVHFAGRLAAKEAVAKVLRPPPDEPLPWVGIEIARADDGAPAVRLSEHLRELAAEHGVGEIQVSLSHCDDYAVAVAVACSP